MTWHEQCPTPEMQEMDHDPAANSSSANSVIVLNDAEAHQKFLDMQHAMVYLPLPIRVKDGIPYWDFGAAEVKETPDGPNGGKESVKKVYYCLGVSPPANGVTSFTGNVVKRIIIRGRGSSELPEKVVITKHKKGKEAKSHRKKLKETSTSIKCSKVKKKLNDSNKLLQNSRTDLKNGWKRNPMLMPAMKKEQIGNALVRKKLQKSGKNTAKAIVTANVPNGTTAFVGKTASQRKKGSKPTPNHNATRVTKTLASAKKTTNLTKPRFNSSSPNKIIPTTPLLNGTSSTPSILEEPAYVKQKSASTKTIHSSKKTINATKPRFKSPSPSETSATASSLHGMNSAPSGLKTPNGNSMKPSSIKVPNLKGSPPAKKPTTVTKLKVKSPVNETIPTTPALNGTNISSARLEETNCTKAKTASTKKPKKKRPIKVKLAHLQAMKKVISKLQAQKNERSLFQCEHCPKRFWNFRNCEEHQWIHTGVKAFTCPSCPKEFAYHCSMKSHIKKMHDVNADASKPYRCDDGKMFSRKDYSKQLKIGNVDKRPFKCNVCEKEFALRGRLMSHVCSGKAIKVKLQ